VKEDGAIHSVSESSGIFFDRTHFAVGRKYYSLPGNIRQVADYANPAGRTEFAAGDTLGGGYMTLGDHLFVERFSLYLKPPARGDVMVFNTENLSVGNTSLSAASGYYYIKRIAGIGGDTLKIVDNVLYIRPKGEKEFRRADELCPQMKKIYSFRGGYQGHAPLGLLADEQEITVPEKCYFALGDNTNNSLDSRMWGVVPHRNIIGRPFNIFWPISRRWGFVDRLPPLDCATVFPQKSTQPKAMRLQ
jgi:signal peptidase I